jgi:hypothetical protein
MTPDERARLRAWLDHFRSCVPPGSLWPTHMELAALLDLADERDRLRAELAAMRLVVDTLLLKAAPIAAAFQDQRTTVEGHEYDGFLCALAELKKMWRQMGENP